MLEFLIDNLQITIKLIKNEKYRFVAFIIKDGKNKIEEENNKFSQPFNCELNNKFIYEKHSDYLQSYTLKDGNEYYIANIEIYSGLLDNYIPSGNGDISIPMARFESFGAEFEAEDFSEGVIQITLESDKDTGLGTVTSPTLSFEYPTTNISEIFSVLDNNDMLWNDSDLEATLNVTWIKADNTEVILGNPTITFKRDCKTTIKFSVESTNDAINFDIDESELGDGGTYVVDGNTTTKEQ